MLPLKDVMLAQGYNAKLSDFGLAKDGPRGDQTHVSTRVMGTYGYAAPEYVMTGLSLLFSLRTCHAFKIGKIRSMSAWSTVKYLLNS